MTISNIESLRQRVQALGFDLITDTDTESAQGPGIYVRDPKQNKLVFLGGQGGQDAFVELETWVVDRETDNADATAAKPEHSLAALSERARKLGLQLLEHHDGVFSVHEKGYSEWRRDFDTIEEVDEWFRESARQHLIGGIQNALYGIRSIATILSDQDEIEHSAALDTIVRECNRALEGIDLLPVGGAA
jgi:hypothetical protein